MDSRVVVAALALALVWAVTARREGFCPAGWGPGATSECEKTYPELRCSAAMGPDGQVQFGSGCSRYARDTITQALKS